MSKAADEATSNNVFCGRLSFGSEQVATALSVLFVLGGMFLRIHQYLFNRSFWIDEAFIANSILDTPYLQMINRPFPYGHFVPVGFMWLCKVCSELFGGSEYALRFVPLCCGMITLLLGYFVARRYLSLWAQPLMLLFLALSDTLIYYSSELKQYSFDACVSLALLLLADYFEKSEQSLRNWLIFCLAGLLAICFSLPSAFLLTSLLIVMAYAFYAKGNFTSLGKFALVAVAWLIFFIANNQALFSQDPELNPLGTWVHRFFALDGGFMPPLFSGGFAWLCDRLPQMFIYPAGFSSTELAFFAFVTGAIVVCLQNTRLALLVLLPFVFSLLTSYLGLYPFSTKHFFAPRTILFLLPGIYLLMAEGVMGLQLIAGKRAFALLPSLILAASLLYSPAKSGLLDRIQKPRSIHEIKPALAYLKQHLKSDELLYVSYYSEPAFRYYAKRYGFDYSQCHLISSVSKSNEPTPREIEYYFYSSKMQPSPLENTRCILGSSQSPEIMQDELRRVGARANFWYLKSHGSDEDLKYLDSSAKLLERGDFHGATASLYQNIEKKD